MDQGKALLSRIRDFMAAEVYPLEALFFAHRFSELAPKLQAVRGRVKELGLWAPHLPAEYGGVGLSFREFAYVSEELGRSPLGHYLFNCQAPDIGNMELLLAHGSEEQKARFLVPLARGEAHSCFAMTEPENPGSNPTMLDCRARADGDHWVIDGHKWFTTGYDGAAFAIVMAVTNPDAGPYERASQILVPLPNPGVQLVRNLSVMGEQGGGYFSHAEIRLHGCRVPKSNTIGQAGMGFVLAQERLGPGRIHHCMRWIGICERAFELMCAYAAKRQAYPGKALGTRQVIHMWIAECRAEILASRLMVLHAAEKMDEEGTLGAREEISLIKFFVANVLGRVLDRAIQVHGGLGVTDDTPLAFWYRHERASRIYDGPDEVHKVSVAKRILRAHRIHL